MRLRRGVEVLQQRAGADAGDAPARVDDDLAHAREVDHQAALGDGVAGDVMAAAANAEQHPMAGGEAHRRLHVGLARAAGDRRRAAIDGGVPDLARRLVVGVARAQHATADLRRKGVDVGAAKLADVSVERQVGHRVHGSSAREMG